METIFRDLGAKWPSTWVARTDIERFTGGLISEKYIANLDCTGKGPAGRVRCGRKVVYPVANVIKWLQARSTPIHEKVRDGDGLPDTGGEGTVGGPEIFLTTKQRKQEV
jgi:hypothetical protein